jgi:hypothetical protein
MFQTYVLDPLKNLRKDASKFQETFKKGSRSQYLPPPMRYHEDQSLSIFDSQWPEKCLACYDMLEAGNRLRICDDGHSLCISCAANLIRSRVSQSRHVTGNMALCPYKEKSENPYDQGHVLFFEAFKCIPIQETAVDGDACLNDEHLHRFENAIVKSLHENGVLWANPQCPHCYEPLQVPIKIHKHGGFIKCENRKNKVCTRCNVEWISGFHSGVTCEDRNLRHAAPDMTEEEMNRNGVKPCPKCKLLIQKIDGCDHMVCGMDTHGILRISGGCGFEFCWDCGVDRNLTVLDAMLHRNGCRHRQ